MRLLATLMAALLLFSGCADDPKPKEPKKTSTPKPTATAPSMPPEASEGTDNGAEAFVSHYVDVLNYASNTGDVEGLRSLSTPECDGCSGYIDLYESTYAEGGFFKGSDWTLSPPRAELQRDKVVVFAHVTAPAGTFKKSRTSEIAAGNAEDFDAVFLPERRNGHWLMNDAGRQAKK